MNTMTMEGGIGASPAPSRPSPSQPASRDLIYERIVDEIVTGRLKGGAKLPTMQRLAEANGVTFRVARAVVERLVREGYARSFPHIGTLVRTKNRTVWNGRVAFIHFDDDCASYFVSSIQDALRRHVIREGYLIVSVVASRNSRGDCSQLKVLLGQRVDFFILMYPSRHLEKLLAASGVPFAVLFGRSPSRPDAWSFALDMERPIASFVRHCVAARVRSVAEVGYAGGDNALAAKELRDAGIAVSKVEVEPLAGFGRPEGIERGAMERFLALPARDFPDLFLFWDDFVAQGALTAFLKRGVRLPEDVAAVVVSNRGLGPVHPDSLTRFEWDGAAVGRQVAAFVMGLLAKGRRPLPPRLSPEYIFGRSFPWRGK